MGMSWFKKNKQIDKYSKKKFRPKNFSEWWNRYGVAYLFLAPYFVFFTVFNIIPVVAAMSFSFTNYNMLQPPQVNPELFMNYRLLFMEDDVFMIAFQNTIRFAVIVGPFGYLISFMAAWVINQLKFRNIFTLAFYAPSIVGSMAVIWQLMFSSDRVGYINTFLINILGVTNEPILWGQSPEYVWFAIITISLWMSMNNGFLVLAAGLHNIDKQFYEAARIDGVRNRVQELWYVTLPLLKPQMLFAAIMAVVSSFSVFMQAKMIAGFPSQNYIAHTVVAHLFDYAFIRFQMGYASAIATILFIITFGLGRVLFRLFRTDD